MEIRNLYTFLQVASIQNFTQAAHILGYSQSNVSAQIRQLEADIGVPLFDRIGRNVVLTQYGQQLIPYAQQVVGLTTQISNMLWSEETLRGILHIGMVESLFDVCFEQIVLRFTERFPKVKVDLTIEATPKLLEMLKKGQLDLACLIGDPLSAADWNCPYVKQVGMVVIAGPKNHLTQKDQIRIEDLNNEKFILMEDIAPYTINFYQALAEHHVNIQLFLSLQSARIARHLVQDSAYLSFLPLYTVDSAIRRKQIIALNIQNYVQMQYVQLVLLKERAITPQIRGFLDEAEHALEKKI